MARPLSELKRDAILEAATEIVAKEGVEAATSRIANLAAVSDGTVFRYFSSKDVLLNELYHTIKARIADSIRVYPNGNPTLQLEAVWTNYLHWGLEHNTARLAMMQLAVSERLTEETRTSVAALFADVEILLEQVVGAEFEGSPSFASAIMTALAETTIQSIITNPSQREVLTRSGFNTLVRALAAA